RSAATSSGLKYSPPLRRSIAPPMLLLPAPLVPASTQIQAGCSAGATAGSSGPPQLGRRCFEQRTSRAASDGRSHAVDETVKLRNQVCQRIVPGREQRLVLAHGEK